MLLDQDIVQVNWFGSCFGQRIILDTTYLVLGNFPVGDSFFQDAQRIVNLVTAGGAIDVQTAYLAALPPQYSLEEIRVQKINGVRSAYFSNGFVATVGTNANAATVANDAACITLRTQKAGRNQVANKHIGPAPDAVSAAGLLVNAYKTVLTALGGKLVISGIPVGSGSIIAPTIYHRAAGTNDLVQQFLIGQQSRVQRRRTVGVGI